MLAPRTPSPAMIANTPTTSAQPLLIICHSYMLASRILITRWNILTNNLDNFSFPELSEFNGLPTAPNAFPTASNAFPITSSVTSPTSTLSPSASKTGEKRKLNAISDPAVSGNMDEAARVAAEEDKRRRNTAASARFRIKKKQREQALEKSAKEMTDKAHRLETKVHQLELENKWLKSLITEKNDISKGGFEELYEKFTKGNQEERIPEAMKDGVGTSAHDDDEDDFE